MCHQVIFATQRLCPEIPVVTPDAQGGAFWVMRMVSTEDWEWHLPALDGLGPYQYQAGVMSCGCGFAVWQRLRDEAYDDWELTVGVHQQLVDYLRPLVAEVGRFPLYSFQSGDGHLPITSVRAIALDDLVAAGFQFGDRELLWVYPSQAAREAAADAPTG